MRRRGVVLGLLAACAAACARPPGRRTADEGNPPDEAHAWRDQAVALLTDGLAALRVCDVYAAYRASNGANASLPLVWDPPTTAQWDFLQRQAGELARQADQLMQSVTNSAVDASYWRERRATAAAAHELLDLTAALRGYLDRANHFAPDGDGSGGSDLLQAAWRHWDASAAAWELDRAERISCG